MTDYVFKTEPSGAEVFLDGISLGHTPLEREFQRETSGRTHQLMFMLKGYQPVIREVRFDGPPLDLEAELPPRKLASKPTADESGRRGKELDQPQDYKDNPY